MPMKRVRWATRRLLLIAEVVAAVLVAAAIVIVLFLSHANSSDYRRELAAAVEGATGFVVAIHGPLRFTLSPEPTMIAEEVRIANPAWAERAEMMRVDRVEISFSPIDLLRRRPRFQSILLQGADIHLEINPDKRANWLYPYERMVFPPGQPIPTIIPPDIRHLEMKNSRIVYRDRARGGTIDLAVERADIAMPLQQGMAWSVEGRYFGIPFQADGEGGRLAELVNDAAKYPLQTRVQGAGATLTLDGALARPLSEQVVDFTFTLAGERLRRLDPVLGTVMPDVGPYYAQGQLRGAHGVWQVEPVSARIGPSDLAGRLDIDATQPLHWRVGGRLRSVLLREEDLTGVGVPVPEPNDGRLFNGRPLPFASLGVADLKLRLEAARYVTWPLEMLNLEAQIDLEKGRLRVDPFRTGVAGGRLDLRIEADINQSPPFGKLAGRIDGVVMETLFPAMGMSQPPTGPLDVVLDISGRGTSLRTILFRSQGQGVFLLGRGSLPIRHFDLIASDLLLAAMPWTKSTGHTETNCTAGRFGITDGIATLDSLLIDTGRITVTGGGAINLGTEAIDILLRPRPKDPSLLSLATPMRVTGTLAAPSAAPDALGLAQGAATGLILGSINPLAALVPFFSLGTGNANPCLGSISAMPKSTPLTPLDRLRSFFR